MAALTAWRHLPSSSSRRRLVLYYIGAEQNVEDALLERHLGMTWFQYCTYRAHMADRLRWVLLGGTYVRRAVLSALA